MIRLTMIIFLNDKINYDNFYYLEYYGDPEFIKDKGIIGIR